MKRCPTCNRTFDEDWLAFCTQDGTTLIDESPAKAEGPPPTILAPPPPPPGGWQSPSGSGQFQSQPIPPPVPPSNLGPGQFQPAQQMQPGWQPPPPPPYAQGPKQGLAIASLCCGIFTITIGWCCYLGVFSGLPAIGLGVYQLIQIKNNPDEAGGKPMAIIGIATASFYFVVIAIIIMVWGLATMLQGVN